MIADALSPAVVALLPQMREWVKDCVWRDVEDADDVDEMPDQHILRGIQRFYDGGINAFMRDSQPLTHDLLLTNPAAICGTATTVNPERNS